ncbi:MAG: hypothetical protein ACYTEX_11285 [Planctomycetota bacterium]|jgi:hypothetical protein
MVEHTISDEELEDFRTLEVNELPAEVAPEHLHDLRSYADESNKSELIHLILSAESRNIGELHNAIASVNDRIGKVSTVDTTDATPTVLATISPEVNTAVKILGEVVGCRDDGLEAAIYKVLALARAVPSSEVLTVSGVPNDGSQVEIDGTTYTIKDTPAAAFDVQRDAGTAEANIDNLLAAINLTGTPGTEYHADTTIHPTFSASKASASTMEAVAKTPGTAENGSSVTDPVDVGAVLSWGAAVTSGGLDMALFGSSVTTEYEDAAGWDVTVVVNGSDIEIKATGEADTAIKWRAEMRTVELFAGAL